MLTKLCIISVALLFGADALDLEGAKEQKCFDVKSVTPESAFLASLKTIYLPMNSRLKLYKVASDLLDKDGKDVLESYVYYDSCIRVNLQPNGSIIATGFDNLRKEYLTKPILPNLEKFEESPADGKGYAATAYTTYTDNKSFFVAAGCGDDGQMTWNVGSMYPTLTKDVKDMVIKHLTELGFKKEFFTEIRYDYCDLEDMPPTTA